MSYRNPQIIVDRSAEIYAQGAAKTGALFAQGIASYFENKNKTAAAKKKKDDACLLYTSPSPRDRTRSRMPSSA